jgi:hypothetical protein
MLRMGGGHGASAPLPTLRAIINLTKPDFSKKAGFCAAAKRTGGIASLVAHNVFEESIPVKPTRSV